jgi:hypothetical protein
MYTCLNHNKIIHNIGIAVKEAYDYRQKLVSTNAKIPFRSVIEEPEIILKQLKFLLSNTYMCNDNKHPIQQLIGVSMGSNASPEVANLTLYVDEANFIDQLVRNNQLSLAQKHSFNARYIDDLLTWDVDRPSDEIYGLQLSETTNSDGSVTFLGAKITPLPTGVIDIALFDKTIEWNFPVIRYPHASSNIPPHQTVGIFSGQAVRYRTICSTYHNFKLAIAQLTKLLIFRNHQPSHIYKAWQKHLNTFSHNKSCNRPALNSWFKKMQYFFYKQFLKQPYHPPFPIVTNPILTNTTNPLLNTIEHPSLELSQTIAPFLPSPPAHIITTISTTFNINNSTTPLNPSDSTLSIAQSSVPVSSTQLANPVSSIQPASIGYDLSTHDLFQKYLLDPRFSHFSAKLNFHLSASAKRLSDPQCQQACSVCGFQFKSVSRHKTSSQTCVEGSEFRATILNILNPTLHPISILPNVIISAQPIILPPIDILPLIISPIVYCIISKPVHSSTVIMYWCNIHSICSTCLPDNIFISSLCMLFICPTCGSPEPTSNNTYPFPRVSNDCGPYAVNTIISHITLFDESYIFPTVISPQEFEFYDHSGFPVVIGNTFLPETLFCALSSRFIYPFAPLFQHPHSFQISLLIPSASFGFIIYALSHFYCIIPTTSPDIYTIFDSSGMSISISLSTLSILLQPFYNNSSTTVTLLHCATQCCLCNSDGTIILPCAEHFICSTCSINDAITFTDTSYACIFCISCCDPGPQHPII